MCTTWSVLWIPRGQLRLCGKCKQDWLMVACDPHSTRCFLSRVSFHSTTVMEFSLCWRVTVAPSSQLSVLGCHEADLSIITMAPTATRLSGEGHGEPRAICKWFHRSSKACLECPCCVQRKEGWGWGGEGRVQGGQFPCKSLVSHMPAHLIKAVTRSKAEVTVMTTVTAVCMTCQQPAQPR